MRVARGSVCFIAATLALGCAADVGEESDLAELDQPIVRGQETSAYPQVVRVSVAGSGGSSTQCSGTYIARRVVLTAAHCIRSDALIDHSFVYFGDDYAADLVYLPDVPPPGEPSPWARVEGFRVHPDYDPALSYPDLAIVYVDRELPFAPLPLLERRLGARYAGEDATLVGWGGNRALGGGAGLIQGAGVKREGRATILGSPTAADFDEADPNAGLLDPKIRRDLLKVDGAAPDAAVCAGDSGGPLVVRKHGRAFVAGVAFWGGLGCEGYSMYTRIDPFLPFLRAARYDAGRRPLVPRLECVAGNDEGGLTAYFGYDNHNAIALDVPYSPKNRLYGDREHARPERFAPGSHPFAFSIDFDRHGWLDYRLGPPRGASHRVVASRFSPRCDHRDPAFVCARACDTMLAVECADPGLTEERCVQDCLGFSQAFPGCGAQVNAYWRCVEALDERAAEHWACEPGFTPQPAAPHCEQEFLDALTCGGAL